MYKKKEIMNITAVRDGSQYIMTFSKTQGYFAYMPVSSKSFNKSCLLIANPSAKGGMSHKWIKAGSNSNLSLTDCLNKFQEPSLSYLPIARERTYQFLWIELPWPGKSSEHLRTTYGNTDSCFDLIRSHHQCIPWSQATTECIAETTNEPTDAYFQSS